MKCDGPLLYFGVCGNVSQYMERGRERERERERETTSLSGTLFVSALNLVWQKHTESKLKDNTGHFLD